MDEKNKQTYIIMIRTTMIVRNLSEIKLVWPVRQLIFPQVVHFSSSAALIKHKNLLELKVHDAWDKQFLALGDH